MTKPLIYVAGPYTDGEPILNVRKAIETGEVLRSAGAIPLVPHLSHFSHFFAPHDYDVWIEQGLKYLERCDALFRIEGHSPGSVTEVDAARKWRIPCFITMPKMRNWIDEWRQAQNE